VFTSTPALVTSVTLAVGKGICEPFIGTKAMYPVVVEGGPLIT
jgi:hypothetical protein